MQSLLVPVMAQLLTVGTGANTEVRYVAAELNQRFESASSAALAVGLRLPYLSLDATYSPSVTIAPLETTPRTAEYTDSFDGTATLEYGFRFKRSGLRLIQSATYTLENPVLQALNASPPVPTTATPAPDPVTSPTPAPSQPSTSPAVDARPGYGYRTQIWTLRSGALYDNRVAKNAVLSADANYQMTAGFGASRRDYPLVQGPDGGLELGYRLSARGTASATLRVQYGWSELGNKAFLSGFGPRYGYLFSRSTRGDIGVGITYSNAQLKDEPRRHSVYPAGSAGIDHTTRWHRGTLTLGSRVTSAPVLDLTTAVVDPRVGFLLNAGWTRRRFSLTADASAALSMTGGGENSGALNSISANLTAGYDLGAGFRADSGVRAAWQTFEEVVQIPASLAVFVGVSWGIGAQFGQAPAQR